MLSDLEWFYLFLVICLVEMCKGVFAVCYLIWRLYHAGCASARFFYVFMYRSLSLLFFDMLWRSHNFHAYICINEIKPNQKWIEPNRSVHLFGKWKLTPRCVMNEFHIGELRAFDTINSIFYASNKFWWINRIVLVGKCLKFSQKQTVVSQFTEGKTIKHIQMRCLPLLIIRWNVIVRRNAKEEVRVFVCGA